MEATMSILDLRDQPGAVIGKFEMDVLGSKMEGHFDGGEDGAVGSGCKKARVWKFGVST